MASFALELDYVALHGSGTDPEPKGVKNDSNLTKTPLAANGATPNLRCPRGLGRPGVPIGLNVTLLTERYLPDAGQYGGLVARRRAGCPGEGVRRLHRGLW